jgi:hypothetical protein
MTEQGTPAWNELGIVSDDESGVAARVFIGTQGRVPIPMVQLGRLGPGETDFFPSIVPEVNWVEGRGSLPGLQQGLSMPEKLAAKVQSILEPHLVLPDANDLDDDDFRLIEVGSPSKRGENALWCGLKCS